MGDSCSVQKPRPRPLKGRHKVWVVIHCEWFRLYDCPSPNVSELAFHVSSTLAYAERYMRKCIVSSYSWWGGSK